MPKIALSDAGVRALTAPEKGTADYWDTTFPAFGVRVSQGGARTFILNINKTRRKLGRYPILKLAEARTQAKQLLAEKTLGKTRPQSITYERAKELFLAEKRKARRQTTIENYEDRFKRHLPYTGQLAGFNHVELANRLAKVRTPGEHDHTLSVAKTFFNWAYNRRLIDDNPTRGMKMYGRSPRTRVLSDDELKAIWRLCEMDHTELPDAFRAIVRLLILTGMRRGECSAIQSSWVAGDTLTLPTEITKNKRQHTLPLGPLTQAIVKPLLPKPDEPPALLFPARGKPGLPFNGWSKSKTALDKLSGVAGWTLHDIRRTVASNLAALGVQLPVIERLLNHVSGSFGGIVSVYQRHSYMPEMRAAVEKWEEHLFTLVESA
ncbi:MAG: tyrosine-type recombinase/integrase [Alphaproteobacteria bacterium]